MLISELPDYVLAYRKHKNLKLAAEELGVKWQTLYTWLCKFGEPIVGDKARYGSESDKLAAAGETLFKRLVPSSIDMNEKQFQAKYDFEVHGLKVDVKCSTRKLSNIASKQKRWAFSIKKQRLIADFLICFCYGESGLDKCLAIPGEIARNHGTISLSCRGGKWSDYEIDVAELNDFIIEVAKAKAA